MSTILSCFQPHGLLLGFAALAACLTPAVIVFALMRRPKTTETLAALRSALNRAPSALAFFDREQQLIFHNDAFADVIATYGIKAEKNMRFQAIVAAANAGGLPDTVAEEALA